MPVINYPPEGGSGGSLPTGGTTGQVLAKASNADGDAIWQNGIPTGGTAGQVLSKIDSTNYNTQWIASSGSSVVDYVAYTYFGGF